MWILGSFCDSLQEQVVTTPGNAKAVWDHLKDLFHDSKDARAINLDNELRAIKIGKMTVSEKNLVIYAVNGLDSRFATLAELIRHREPLPNFETVRDMLLLKESSFDDDSGATNTFEKVALPLLPFSWHQIHPPTKTHSNASWATSAHPGYHSTRLAQYQQQATTSQPTNQPHPLPYGLVQYT
ncbi:hypothetical protein Tco_0568009 [Tanacetum coccineum]